MRIITIVIVLVSIAAAGERKPCCTATPTEAFAAFGKDMAFAALHAPPEPFVFQSQSGTMRTLKVKNGPDANIYEIPASSTTNNYLFVFHEWWGLNDYIKREAERLQRDLGPVNVIAVDLYDGAIAASPDSARLFVGRVQDQRARDIIAAVIDHAGKKARIATLGWCFGGGWSMQASLMLGKQAAGCVIYYGMPERDAQKLRSLQCDVLGIFATQDGFISPAVVTDFERSMSAAKKKLTVKNFDAVHAFANPSNPDHDKEKTAQANVAAVAFLRSALKIQ